MFENFKVTSKKLCATFKITVFLPNDYDKNANIYNSLFIVSGSNPFTNPQYKLESYLASKNLLGFAIYPSIDVSKNKLLYNSFDSKYNYALLYEDFIINELKPLLTEKYRINKGFNGNFILGIKDTAILAYSLAYHYTNNFEKLLAHELSLNNDKLFMSDLMSKFDPNISFYFSTTNNSLSKVIEERLRLFGAVDIYLGNQDITSLIERL